MGCDIHGPEIWGRRRLGPAHGYWTDHIATLDWNRDYYCFGVIAGVRDDDVTPVALPRGFPGVEWFGGSWHYTRFSGEPDPHRMDECEAWHAHYYNQDCHSASWLTTHEVGLAQREYVKSTGQASGDIAMALMIMRTAESNGYEDVRLLFCFDN